MKSSMKGARAKYRKGQSRLGNHGDARAGIVKKLNDTSRIQARSNGRKSARPPQSNFRKFT